MGLYDHLRISDYIVKVLNQYTGCDQELDGEFQTSVHDRLAHLYIQDDLTISDVPDGVYPIRHFYGHTMYFVVKDGSVNYWLYQYSFKQGSYIRNLEFNEPKVIASKKVERGIEWRTVHRDSIEHNALMKIIQKYLYDLSEAMANVVVPPMVEILSLMDLETFGYIQVIMEERAICDYLIYKLETDHATSVFDIMIDSGNLFGTNRSLFDRIAWHPGNDTRESLITRIRNEKVNGESYAYKITPCGEWDQLQTAIKRLYASYEF